MISRSLGFAIAVVFSLAVLAPAASGATFSSSGAIAVPDGFPPAAPYPSTISVSGVTGPVITVRATLKQMSDAFPNDLDILLVGPSGAKSFLISDVCSSGATPLNGVTFVFDDAAPSFLPTAEGHQCVSGVYKPTDFADGTGGDAFLPPAPAGPYGAALSVFKTLDPNGTWQLFVRDDDSEGMGGPGSIPAWSLDISTPAPLVTKKKKCKKKHHGRHKAAIAKKKKCKKHHK